MERQWPATAEEAIALQERLRPLVRVKTDPSLGVRTVAGLDVGYAEGSDLLAAAVVVLDAETLDTVDSAVVTGTSTFPRTPGFSHFGRCRRCSMRWNG